MDDALFIGIVPEEIARQQESRDDRLFEAARFERGRALVKGSLDAWERLAPDYFALERRFRGGDLVQLAADFGSPVATAGVDGVVRLWEPGADDQPWRGAAARQAAREMRGTRAAAERAAER